MPITEKTETSEDKLIYGLQIACRLHARTYSRQLILIFFVALGMRNQANRKPFGWHRCRVHDDLLMWKDLLPPKPRHCIVHEH